MEKLICTVYIGQWKNLTGKYPSQIYKSIGTSVELNKPEWSNDDLKLAVHRLKQWKTLWEWLTNPFPFRKLIFFFSALLPQTCICAKKLATLLKRFLCMIWKYYQRFSGTLHISQAKKVELVWLSTILVSARPQFQEGWEVLCFQKEMRRGPSRLSRHFLKI